MPFGPVSTVSTSEVSGSMVMTTVLCRATSAGEPAAVAPAAATSSVAARLRLCTTSVWPALIRFFAMGLPMTPSPTKPIVSATACPFTCQVRLKAGHYMENARPGRKRATAAHTHVPPRLTHVPPRLTYVPPRLTYVPPRLTHVPPRLTYVPPRLTYVPPRLTHVPAAPHA